MRYLILFRGAAGCGKSTFIEHWGCKNQCICPDDLRIKIAGLDYIYSTDETFISQKADRYVWNLVYDILEQRFENGLFTLLDATNTSKKSMVKLRNLAKKYKYKVILVDMTSVPKEVVKERNRTRIPEYKRVPDSVIDHQYEKFATESIPAGVEVIPYKYDPNPKVDYQSFENAVDRILKITHKPILDLSKYKKIVHIGDIHGCYKVLREAIPEIDPDTYYIFCGDYIDRGNQNAEVIKWLMNIVDLPNVTLLEGNHEKWLRRMAYKDEIQSEEFATKTAPQLLNAGISLNDIKTLYNKMKLYLYYIYNDCDVLVSHGGVSKPGDTRYLMPAKIFTNGLGTYEDIKSIMEDYTSIDANCYQVCGHRNPDNLPIRNGNCFLLEGNVENGGCLRTATLTPIGWWTQAYHNYLVDRTIQNKCLLDRLRSNEFIKEKDVGYGISSFNFTRDAFYKRHWDDQNIKARGLFVNTNTGKIEARAYDKFFNLDEMPETELHTWADNAKFPVDVYKKENGYLGIISYNKDLNTMMFCTKSCLGLNNHHGDESVYIERFKKLFKEKYLGGEMMDNFISDPKVSTVVEVVDPAYDPHIIKYEDSDIYLLDIIDNKEKTSYLSLDVLKEATNKTGLKCKTQVTTLNSKKEFYDFIKEVSSPDYKYMGKYIEGFVFRDKAGNMVKYKTEYYNTWKKLRGIILNVKEDGKIKNEDRLTGDLEIKFYHFLQKYFTTYPDGTENIIELRDKFYSEVNNES